LNAFQKLVVRFPVPDYYQYELFSTGTLSVAFHLLEAVSAAQLH
jgi:hypothetical protein